MIKPARPRRLNLVDVIVLVLATAVGLWAIRPYLPGLLAMPEVFENGKSVPGLWEPVVWLNSAVVVEPVLMAWSVAWLVLQLRQPRPRLRRLIRQPGFVATFASAVVLLVSGPIAGVVLTSEWRSANISTQPIIGPPRPDWIAYELWSAMVSLQIGASVLAVWGLLAVGRQCRMKSGWLDRVGQGFGIVWAAMIPGNLILPFWQLV
jgi:hypothetical protein